MDSTLWYQSQDQKLYVYWPDMTIRDQNCLVCVNLSQSQNLYVYWPDLTFLDQIWRFGTRIVDSTQTPNQQSGWSVFFSEWQSPFWRPESTKWVPESTKWVPESTKGAQNQQRGTQNQQSGKARNNKSGRASYMSRIPAWPLSCSIITALAARFLSISSLTLDGKSINILSSLINIPFGVSK